MCGLESRRKKGFRSERELVEKFKEFGLWSVRIPVSGVAKPLPDVMLFYKGKIFGFEVKYLGEKKHKHIYYLKDFDNLKNWFEFMKKEEFLVEAYLAVKFRGGKWRFYKIDEETEKIEVNINFGYSFRDLLKIITKSTP